MEESGSDESSDDGNLDFKGDGFHDAENDVDLEVEEDPDRVLSGKLSESSGYAGSDLYDYKVWILVDKFLVAYCKILFWSVMFTLYKLIMLSVIN